MTTHTPVFTAAEVKVGDTVQYPSILRPEHNGVRSLLRVTRVEPRRIFGVDLDRGGDCEYVVEPLQIEENGLVVVDWSASFANDASATTPSTPSQAPPSDGERD